MGDSIPDAVPDMSFQDHLSALMQSRLCGIELREYILTGNIFIDHPVNRLYLPDDLFQPAVQVFRIHTLSHGSSPLYH